MGITINSVECILSLRNELDFTNLLLLGHQQFFDAQASRYCELAAKFGLPDHRPQHIGFKEEGYADEWFRLLGANRLEILDASNYEGATLIHDMNRPLTDDLRNNCYEQMSLVFDGGSLEHIFNIPQALINISEMLAVGGHYLALLPCNNWGGHGFYQFNPELFYRAFDNDAGFSNTRVWLFNERGQLNIQYWPDPKSLCRRVEFLSQDPISLLVLTKKIARKKIFEYEYPQQSDYQYQLWQQK